MSASMLNSQDMRTFFSSSSWLQSNAQNASTADDTTASTGDPEADINSVTPPDAAEPEGDSVEISGEQKTLRINGNTLSFSRAGAYQLSQRGYLAIRTMTQQLNTTSDTLFPESFMMSIGPDDTAENISTDITTNTDADTNANVTESLNTPHLDAPLIDTEVDGWLQDLDPDLFDEVQSLLTMLRQTDPDAAILLADSLRSAHAAFASMGQASSSMTSEMASATSSHIATSVSASISTSVSANVTVISRSSGQGLTAEDLGVEGSITGVSVSSAFQMQINTNQVSFADPLVIDMNGDGIALRSMDDGVLFDINGDGQKEQTAFIQGDDALLFLDENNNGTADDAHELFGDIDGDAHGFAKLGRYDSNGDNQLDANDEAYADMRIWQDLNGDGTCQQEEVQSLADAGLESLSLAYEDMDLHDTHGNQLTQAALAQGRDGASRVVADILFRYQPNAETNKTPDAPA